MKRYDLHIHSDVSPDSINTPQVLLKAAKKAGLDGIAVTDHYTIEGALRTKKLNKDRKFEVIVGQEVSTCQGELIALYIKRKIRQKKLFKAIDEIKSQGGIVIVPHPFRIVNKFEYPLHKLKGMVDGVEAMNSRYVLSNMRVSLMKPLPFALIGSSDAHSLFDIGHAYTEFEGSLRAAIRNRKTVARGTAKYGLISQAISDINLVTKRIKKGLPLYNLL